MSFESLGLRAELLQAVADQGYTEPTPIQRQAIPHIIEGRDLMGGAQTGTGKTAGFTLPLLQQLMRSHAEDGRHRVRALILTPTRELAQQVGDSVHIYGRHLPLHSAIVYGGVNFNQQLEQIKKGVDVLIATPGRLLDHVGQKTLDLSKVEIFVLDEADRMLDMGFIPDVRRIARLLPKKRQTMLFSATLPPEIRMLAHDFLRDPVTVQVAPPNTAAEQIKQVIHTVDRSRKRELLVKLIKEGDWQQVLVFVNMKVDASSLTQQLQRDGINASAIHGDRTQEKRTKALAGFKKGKIAVLVATDVASRGLDIDQLPHVVNFELPQVPEDYIHRIGRTGRAGKDGEAVSLVSPEEEVLLKNIESLLGIDIPRVSLPEFEPDSRLTRRALKTRTRTAPAAADSSDDGSPHVHWSRYADADKDADKKQSTG